MADDKTLTTTDAAKSKSTKLEGLDKPIEDPGEGKVPDHINAETLMLKGVDPDTKERVAISLAALQHEHGKEKGTKLYGRIAKAGGFLDPAIESRGGSEYYPDLSLDGMDKKARERVNAILSTKE